MKSLYCIMTMFGAMGIGGVSHAQDDSETIPRVLAIEREMEEVKEVKEKLFLMNRIPALSEVNRALNRFDRFSPLRFGAETWFASDWLDEGANSAKRGLQVLQTYFTEWDYPIGEASAGAGFCYFQADTTGACEGPSTLERDFTLYAPLAWKFINVAPSWNYIYYEEDPDSGEIGTCVTLDVPFQPTFLWNYDYRTLKGSYFEWSMAREMDISFSGEKLAVFRPSMALGMDNHKVLACTHLTHIDWGIDLNVPLMEHIIVGGMLHFTKSLCRAQDEDGCRSYENIIPWAGLKLTAEF